jgi:hypothetical protein
MSEKRSLDEVCRPGKSLFFNGNEVRQVMMRTGGNGGTLRRRSGILLIFFLPAGQVRAASSPNQD